MARKKKPKDTYEYFIFTVDDWTREYRFGINRRPWELDPNHHSEGDEIRVAGRLRLKTKRKLTTGEAHILPSHVPRDKFSAEADRIGNAWTKQGRLFCSAFIPADAYYSLPACLAEGKFVEMTMQIKNLRYARGKAHTLGLDFELSDIDEEERAELARDPVRVRAVY